MNIFCPFCNDVRKARAFGITSSIFATRTVVDAGPRPLALCGTCGSVERERMFHTCMSGYIGTKESKLLHFAPSRATHRWLLTFKNIEATNTDINPNGYRHVPDMVQADITALHFDDGLFDFVFCSHVMEHIPDDFQAMTELHRVLKPGGIAFLMVPLLVDGKGPIEDPSKTLPRHRLRYFGQVDHVRIYDSPTFIERLEKAGFNVDVFDPYANDPIKAVAYGIGQGNAVFVAKK